jgi:hypothetical protein
MTADDTLRRRGALLMMLGGVVVLAVAGALLLINAPARPAAATTAGPLTLPGEAPRIALAEARAAFDAGAAVFVDVRNQAAYDQGHIPGAVLIPLADVEARLAQLDPATPIITYCT